MLAALCWPAALAGAAPAEMDEKGLKLMAKALYRNLGAGLLLVGAGLASGLAALPDAGWRNFSAVAGMSDVMTAQSAPSGSDIAGYTGLLKAVAGGDRAEAGRLIAAGADVNMRDRVGRTPVMVAAHRRDLEMARLLVAAGADLNARDNQAYDVLTISGVLDDEAMVKFAIASGADTALVTSPYNGTALIASAHLGHDGVVRALIAGGAPVDHVNNLNWTALIEVIVLGDGGPRHVASAKALIDAGANVNLPDGSGATPLTLARRRGFAEIVKLLEAAGAKP